MHGSRRRSASSLVAGLAALVAAGCTAPGGVSEAGFAEPAVTMTMEVADPPGRYSFTLAEDFARRVDTATAGAVQVRVQSMDSEPRRWNQALADRARDGQVDLALVPAQAWDALGVRTLTALYVPFLVHDEEHLDAVATSNIADELLSGLEGTGVTGLALVPGGMRHLVAEERALVLPADVAGLGVRSPYSTTVWAMLETFTARPADPNGTEVAQALDDGSLSVVDTTLALADSLLSSPTTAGDLTVYPQAFTLVVNDGVFGNLSAGQRESLRGSATATAAWAAQTRAPVAEEARALCARSATARVVLGGAGAAAAWKDATRQLAHQLRSDPVVDALAVRIEELAGGREEAVAVEPCHGRDAADADAGPVTAAPVPSWPTEFPEGTYRKELTVDELVGLGVNTSDAHGHAGVWTITFEDGAFMDPGCPGSTYEVLDQRIVVELGPEGDSCGDAAGQVLFSSGWQLEGRQLTLTAVRSGHGGDVLVQAIFGSAPWTKIG